MNGYDIVAKFYAWWNKNPPNTAVIPPDPLAIGRFMNWLEQTDDGLAYAKRVVKGHER